MAIIKKSFLYIQFDPHFLFVFISTFDQQIFPWPDSGSNDGRTNDGRTNDYSMKRHFFEREKSETTLVRKVNSQKRYKSQPIFVTKNTISKCHLSEWSLVRRDVSSKRYHYEKFWGAWFKDLIHN